ncbi:hypothetical protein ACFV3E_14050 [Streptomyces sp. NPDC059718]
MTVAAEGPCGRREYALTEAGRAELIQWLTEGEPQRNRRNDALLRVFLVHQVDTGRARAYVEHGGRRPRSAMRSCWNSSAPSTGTQAATSPSTTG